MKDHPGGVDNRPQAWTPQLLDHALDGRPARPRLGDGPGATLVLDHALYGEPHQRPAVRRDDGTRLRLLEQLMNAGQISQGSHISPRSERAARSG